VTLACISHDCFFFSLQLPNLDMVCPICLVFYIADDCLEALCVVRGIIQNLRCKVSVKVLNALNPLLASVGLELRLCICDIYAGLSLHDPSMLFLVIITICDVNYVHFAMLPVPVSQFLVVICIFDRLG